VDFAVNDQAFLDRRLIAEEFLVASYLDLIRKFKDSRCIPVFLILPVAPYWQNHNDSHIRKHIIELCHKFSVMYVDVYDFIAGVSGEFPEACFMRDVGHITSFTAKLLARQLMAVLPQAQEIFNSQQSLDVPRFDFRILKAEQMEFVNFERLIRSTSIAQFEVMRALDQDNSVVNIYGEDLLCGIFFHDTNKTNSAYFKTAKGIIRKKLTTCWPGFFLRTFIMPIEADDGIIKMSLTTCDEFIDERTNEYEPQQMAESEIEIIDFLVCDKSYQDKIGLLQNFINQNHIRTIVQAKCQQVMAADFKKGFTQLDSGIIDDIVRYKKECKAAEVYVSDRRQFVDALHRIFRALKGISGNIVVFGAGGMGKRVIESHLLSGLVECVIDNDESKWGIMLCGIPIKSPTELLSLESRLILVVTDYYEEVREQLINMGFVVNTDFIDARPLWRLLV
jgi:hypothetical protein